VAPTGTKLTNEPGATVREMVGGAAAVLDTAETPARLNHSSRRWSGPAVTFPRSLWPSGRPSPDPRAGPAGLP
jgi:hypothetical protein